MWIDKLKAMKEASGLTTKEIALKSGLPEPTLEKLFAGTTKDPRLATLQQLVHFLGYTLDDLDDTPNTKKAPPISGEAMKLAKDYDALDPYGKKQVRTVADNEIARVAGQKAKPLGNAVMFHAYTYTDFYQPSSAGTGQQAGSGESDKAYLKKPAPHGTDYIVRVNGDSMEPDYHDGDRVFVHATEEIIPGEVGIFYMDGKQWIKKLGDGALISLNPDYPPLSMIEDIRCQGKVLGICDDSYFE